MFNPGSRDLHNVCVQAPGVACVRNTRRAPHCPTEVDAEGVPMYGGIVRNQ